MQAGGRAGRQAESVNIIVSVFLLRTASQKL